MAVSLLSFVVAMLILGVTIAVHEFGHFVAARLTGVRVLEAALGWPPPMRGALITPSGKKYEIQIPPQLFRKKVGETWYLLNALPLGGYVNLDQEDESPTSFQNAPKWKRATILIAGVCMNLVLAIICVTIVRYSEGAPLVTSIVVAVQRIFQATAALPLLMIQSLMDPSEIRGIISIVRLSSEATVYSISTNSWSTVLLFTAFLNISIAAFNSFPIPGLDGGRLLFLGIEAIAGPKFSRRIETIATAIGLMLVLGIMVFGLYQDIVNPLPPVDWSR